jgi:hypothetical protein
VIVFELQRIEVGIDTAACQQLVMAALINHLALVHNHDFMRIAYGRQAVGDDQRGAPL